MVGKANKNCILSTEGIIEGPIIDRGSNYRLDILGDESLYDEFYVNLLFDRSVYRPMCTHMGYSRELLYIRHIRDGKHELCELTFKELGILYPNGVQMVRHCIPQCY